MTTQAHVAMKEACQARVRRGGYFSRHDEACGRPAKSRKLLIRSGASYAWDKEPSPVCGIHLRAQYVVRYEESQSPQP